MTPETLSTLDAIVIECASELFEYYDVDLALCHDGAVQAYDTSGRHLSLAGIVGFIGDEVSGAITIAATDPVLSATCPLPKADSHWSQDWIGELSNQLVGRVKNAILRYGSVINLGTPVTIGGSELSVARSPGVRTYAFDSLHGAVVCWLKVSDDATLQLLDVVEDAGFPVEGDALFF